MIASIVLATVSGVLLAMLVCKGVRLRLWADIAAGIGALGATWASALLAGSSSWPLVGLPIGYLLVVTYLRLTRSRQ